MTAHAEVVSGARFAFGANWSRFLDVLDEERILEAEGSLRDMLEMDTLADCSFVDVGCGSGLFSLAARRLGARVVSFDFDPDSVACTSELRRRYFPDDPDWTVQEGSVLDVDFLHTLGQFDVVYSWGVLHHTGAMQLAMAHVADMVAEGGQLFVALYNDQGPASRGWTVIKRTYCQSPRPVQSALVAGVGAYFWSRKVVRRLLHRQNPFSSVGEPNRGRGMSTGHDLRDWVGGYPFEVARPDFVFDFYRARGFLLRRLITTAGGHGCNQFVLQRSAPQRGTPRQARSNHAAQLTASLSS